ncbi:SDR family NAD(P)-dependent oxidoreductase [Nocardia sp. NPDC050175]|uniref:SDR family NAD(P)-dependent oxidoreductase n=1 Tax=Nocardia sp. NPDC050175 TaxID=3364317 RepID=UPI0037BB0559
MKGFGDKVAVITGAGSGIGRALAVDLAGRGARLALSDIDADGLAETATLCKTIGAQATTYVLDVADRDAVYANAEEVLGAFGAVNLVINNAGVALTARVEEMSWEDFEWVMNIDFWGVAYGTKAFLPHLIASGDGHLVNLSSVFGLIGTPTQSAYNAAKFAVRGFTEALRQEMRIAGHPVGVSCVHPGGIKTDIARNMRGLNAVNHEKVTAAFDRYAWTTAQRAATVILRGVERNSARILIGADAYGYDLTPRLLGGRYQDLNAFVARLGSAQAAKRGLEL